MANIYFYKTRMYEEVDGNNKNNQGLTQKKYKSQEDFVKEFKNILSMRDKNNCLDIDKSPDWVILESIRIDKSINFNLKFPRKCKLEDANYIFGRIGKKKDITNVQLRDRVTHKSTQIQKNSDQDLEIYTYFYLFFDTSIIVYLGAQSAPGIYKIGDMFDNYHKNTNLKMEISPVTADNMLEILKHKDIVNSMEITSTLPSDAVIDIDSLVGLSEDDFDNMRDSKNVKMTVSITAGHRNKNLFSKKELIKKVANKILNKNPSKLSFKAKNNDEHIQSYDVIEKMFTRSVQFKYNTSEGEERKKEIEETLLKLYNENRSDIIKYCRD